MYHNRNHPMSPPHRLATPFALSLSKGLPSRRSCEGRNPDKRAPPTHPRSLPPMGEGQDGGAPPHTTTNPRREPPPPTNHTVVPAKAGTQGRGAARGPPSLDASPPPRTRKQHPLQTATQKQNRPRHPGKKPESRGGTHTQGNLNPSAHPPPPARHSCFCRNPEGKAR